jgi:hypothetical protein
MNKFKCKQCKMKICYHTFHYGSGLCKSCCKRGRRNPMFGRIQSKDTRVKMSMVLKGKKRKPRTKEWCGNISKANKIAMNRPEVRKKISKSSIGKKISKKACDKMSKAKLGKNNINYIHGLSKLPYSPEFTPSLKKFIKERDNHKCQCCGMTQEEHYEKYGRDIEIHHIDYCYFNCNENNLITTCKQCNLNANKDRDYHYAYFTYKIENYLIKGDLK